MASVVGLLMDIYFIVEICVSDICCDFIEQLKTLIFLQVDRSEGLSHGLGSQAFKWSLLGEVASRLFHVGRIPLMISMRFPPV